MEDSPSETLRERSPALEGDGLEEQSLGLPIERDALIGQDEHVIDEEELFGPEDPEPVAEASPGEGERDLFGSENESPPRVAEHPSERDVFGDEGDDANINENELFGSEDEADGEYDEKELFGSDDDAPQGPEGAAQAAPGSPARSELSDMNEREIFGDVSEDEPEKSEDLIIRRRPAPTDDRLFMSLRLPNVLSIEKTAYSVDTIAQSALEGFKEFTNTQNKAISRLLNPENCIRWRFKKGPDGHNLTDEDGRPQYEANSRIVEWEDGSKTLYIGKESFEVSEIEDNLHIFEENSQDVHVCHGLLKTRLIVTPRDLSSASHEMLKRTQYHKFEANRRSLLISEQQEDNQRLLEIQEATGEAQRQRRELARQKRALEMEPAGLTAAFLEDDGGNNRDLKRLKGL